MVWTLVCGAVPFPPVRAEQAPDDVRINQVVCDDQTSY